MKEKNIAKDWILWAVELAEEIIKDLEDKKFTVWEGLGLTDNAFKLPALIRRSTEFKDLQLTNEIRAELHSEFVHKFNLPNKKTEQLVELCVESLLVGLSIAQKFATIVKK